MPSVAGEYGYYVPSLMKSNGMIHYWSISTTGKENTLCHFSHSSPYLNVNGARLIGRIINVKNTLSTY
jgi:hypothetical protein